MMANNLPTQHISNRPEVKLPPRLAQAARMIALGFKHREICERLGISESHLSITAQTDLFKMVVSQLESELNSAVKVAQNTLIEAAPKAAEKVVGILVDTEASPRLKLEAAMHILKGSGAVKTEESKPQININLSETKMNIIMETIQQIKGG